MGNFNFIGNYSYTIDEKNRFNIPAKFRKQLDDESNQTFILSIGLDKCVNAYPLSYWKTELNSLKKLDQNKADNRKFARAIAAYADDARLDKQGRLVVPPTLKKYANLKKNIVLVGFFNKIEIWDEEIFNAEMKDPVANIEALAEKVASNE